MAKTADMTTRTERDSMGEMEVPADALYGASTQRAVLNFPISGQPMPHRFLRALALIKLAAAETNGELGLIDPDVANAIAAAAASVADGDHDEQFPIDIYQTGSGTSTNTNMNEVIAHLAARRLGGDRKVHPNDDVNRSQSSNDTIPTALQLSAAMAIEEELLPALERLHTALVAKEQEFWPIVKTGRTHLQDATPIRLGQEFRGYAGQVEESLRRARTAAGRVARGAPRRDRGRDRDQRPSRVRVPDDRPALHAQRPRGPRDGKPLPRPGHARRGDRGAWGDPDDRAQSLEDRLGHPADGDGSAGGSGRTGSPRDPAGFEHHARQGEPGHRREPHDGRRPRGRE